MYSAGFGFFPSLFGLQFHTFGLGAGETAGGIRTLADGRRVRIVDGREVPVTQEEERQEALSRMLLFAGFIIIAMLLFL